MALDSGHMGLGRAIKFGCVHVSMVVSLSRGTTYKIRVSATENLIICGPATAILQPTSAVPTASR